MSRQEASWHEHLAGMRAAEKARALGGNPAAIDAVAAATCGPVRIGGYQLQPASQGTIWTLKRMAREFTAWADALKMPVSNDPEKPGTREMLELGLTTLAFCDSQSCYMELETGNLESLISRADSLIWRFPAHELLALQNHFQKQMELLKDLGGDEEEAPKKQPMADPSGSSPAMPTQPEEVVLPSSNGSLLTTASPSKQPSGAPRWP